MPEAVSDQTQERVDVAVGIVVREGRVLICRRRKQDSFADLWEFPGGKREGGEAIEATLSRELLEELGLQVSAIEPLEPLDHDYPSLRIRLHPWLCDAGAGEPQPLASQELRWIVPDTLVDYEFPAGNTPLLHRVMESLAQREGQSG